MSCLRRQCGQVPAMCIRSADTLSSHLGKDPRKPGKLSCACLCDQLQVLEGFNWTQQPLPPFCRAKTMDQILEHWAAEGPGRPCLIFEGQQLSYGEVDGRANQLAHHLIALGVTPGSSVGVMMERSFGEAQSPVSPCRWPTSSCHRAWDLWH